MINNSYSTGSHGFMAVSNKLRPRATPLDSVNAFRLRLFTAINPWHCAITITYTNDTGICVQDLVLVL